MAEVVPNEIEGQCRFQILPLLGERISQAGEPANLHSQSQIRPLNMRCTNLAEFGIAPLRDWDRIDYFGGGIPGLAITASGIHFDELREINTSAKAHMNGINERLESIRRDLEMARRGLLQFLREGHCVAGRSPSKVPSQHGLGISLDRYKAIGIPAHRVAVCIVLLFTSDESPYLVALNIADGQGVDSVFQKALTFAAHLDKQRKNCGVVKAGEAFNGANGASLSEKLNRLGRLFERCVHRAQRRGVIFGESLAALLAAESLKAVAVASKLFTLRLAVVAGHEALVDFLTEKPHNECVTFRCGLRPRLDLAPSIVSAIGGASYLPPAKFERSPNLAANNFAALSKPLQNRIYKGQRILNAAKVVSPTLKNASHFSSTQIVTLSACHDCPYKLRPCDFRLSLLTKCVLDSNRRSLQLRNFHIKLISRMNFAGNVFLNLLKRFLECIGHRNSFVSNTLTLYTCGA